MLVHILCDTLGFFPRNLISACQASDGLQRPYSIARVWLGHATDFGALGIDAHYYE